MAHTLRSEDLAFVDRAPLQVREEILVPGADPGAVWPALADAPAWVEWFGGMKAARYTTPEPHGVGSTRSVHVATMKVNEEILAFDVGERFAFRVIDGNVPVVAAMVEVATLEPVGGGTKVVYRQAVEMEPWARLLGPLVRRQLQGRVRKALPRLARWVAERPGPGGPEPAPG